MENGQQQVAWKSYQGSLPDKYDSITTVLMWAERQGADAQSSAHLTQTTQPVWRQVGRCPH